MHDTLLSDTSHEAGRRWPLRPPVGLLLAVAVFLFYLAHLPTEWQVTNDSALYLLLGRNLAQGEGYAIFGQAHAHVPPGFPWSLAALMRVGITSFLALNFAMLLCALAALWFGYRALAQFVAPTVALASILVVAFSWPMYMHSTYLLSDIPFMALVCAALWCLLRGLQGGGLWLEAGTLLLIATCWTRVVGFPLAMAAAPALFLHPRRVPGSRVATNVAVLLIGLAVTYMIFHHRYVEAVQSQAVATYSLHVERFQSRSPAEWCTTSVANFFDTGSSLIGLFGGRWFESRLARWLPHPSIVDAAALLLSWLPILAGMLLGLRRRQWLPLFAVAGYIGALTLNGPLMVRYLLPVAPLLALYLLTGAQWLFSRMPKAQAFAPLAIPVAAALLIAVNLPDDLYRIYHVRFGRRFEHQQVGASAPEVAQFLRKAVRSGECFAGDQALHLAYLSDVPYLQNQQRLIRRRPKRGTPIAQTFADHRVALVVCLNPDHESTISQYAYRRRLRRAVRKDPELKPVFRNEHFTVFSTKPRDSVRHENPH